MNTLVIKSSKAYLLPLTIIGIMFFVIGFGVGISGFLTPALKEALNLTTTQSYFVTVALFSAFVIFGAPAGWLIKKIGYKYSMMFAFYIMALGMWLFIPSSKSASFPLFLVALFVGGIGNTLLQASVNPYITIIGPIESAATRMSLMGILNKTAWWIAPVFLGIFIDLNNVNIKDLEIPFDMVAIILFALGSLTFVAPLPEVKAEGEDESMESNTSLYASSKTSIFQFPHLLLGVVSLFLYVGIETLPMVSIIDFARATFGDVNNLAGYSKFVTIGLISGYLFGTVAIPKFISQTNALILFSFIGIIATALLMKLPATYGFYALVLVSFANSLMWPAIWPLAMKDLGKFTKTGSSLLVMGIVGGAVVPLIFGFLVDSIHKASESLSTIPEVGSYQSAYVILFPCYLFILFFALKGHKIRN